MTLKQERRIIFRAVWEAVNFATKKGVKGTRNEIGNHAAHLADNRSVNVMAFPYRQDIFFEALDKKEKEGKFRKN